MKIIGLIQSRLGSSRLPNKALREINGLPLVRHIYRRLLGCKELDGVAVSTCGKDQGAIGLQNIRTYAWKNEDNLIQRHWWVCSEFRGDAFVRIYGDCLFVDPSIIDQSVRFYRDNYPKYRAVTNWHPYRTWSEGVDLDIWSMELIAELDRTKECPREDFATYAANKYSDSIGHIQGLRKDLQNMREAFYKDGDIHLSVDTQKDIDRSERMLKILGNDEWQYEKTLEAYHATAK